VSRLRRSLHFVPGGNDRMLERALTLEADALVLDLEDAVPPERKPEARATVAGWLADAEFGTRERIVRANPLDSPWGIDDLEALMRAPPDALLVPKVRDAGDVQALDIRLTGLEEAAGFATGDIELILIATETPQGVLNLPQLAASPRVSAVTWGAEDLSAALGARRTRDEAGRHLPVFEHCRSMTLLSASAAGVAALDTVFVDVRDHAGLEREARDAAQMGFAGKITIHPDQVPIVNRAFTPSREEVDAARALIEAFERHQTQGRMTFTFRGEMVDVPHLERARRVLATAERIGIG